MESKQKQIEYLFMCGVIYAFSVDGGIYFPRGRHHRGNTFA